MPSVSGDETTLADLVVEALAGAAHLEVIRDGDTVVARTNLGRERRVVIAGHLDTVPINDNLPTRFETIDGERYLWGRGTVDMKARRRRAAEARRRARRPGRRRHVDVVRPRGGLGRAQRPRPARAATGPTCSRATSRSWASPRTRRSRAAATATSASRCAPTACARTRRAAGWARTRSTSSRRRSTGSPRTRRRPSRSTGSSTARASTRSASAGGVAGNVIPDEAMLHVNYRFAPSRSRGRGDRDRARAVPRVRAHGRRRGRGRAARPRRAARAAVRARRSAAEARPKYGWTDVARFSALGIPAVNFGPGDPLKAHADDERVAHRPDPHVRARAARLAHRRGLRRGEMTSAPVERERDAFRVTRSSPRVRWRLMPWWAKVMLVYFVRTCS